MRQSPISTSNRPKSKNIRQEKKSLTHHTHQKHRSENDRNLNLAHDWRSNHVFSFLTNHMLALSNKQRSNQVTRLLRAPPQSLYQSTPVYYSTPISHMLSAVKPYATTMVHIKNKQTLYKKISHQSNHMILFEVKALFVLLQQPLHLRLRNAGSTGITDGPATSNSNW